MLGGGVVMSRRSESGDVRVAEGDVHDAGLGEEVEAVLATLPAKAAGLDTTERGAQVAHDWSEDLLLEDARVGPHVGEHGGLEEVAAGQVRRSPTAGDEPGTFGDA